MKKRTRRIRLFHAFLVGWTLVFGFVSLWLAFHNAHERAQVRVIDEERVVIRTDEPATPWVAFRLIATALQGLVPWLLLIPYIVLLARFLPLNRDTWRLRLLIHIVTSLALSFAIQTFLENVRPTKRVHQEMRIRLKENDEEVISDEPHSLASQSAFWTFNALRVVQRRSDAAIYWIVLSITHAWMYYRRSEDRGKRALELESRLNAARLEALHMQLQPHFLFNTLHAISALVYKDPRAADEMINSLSDLLRSTLNTADKQEIPLRDEVDLLDRYLGIQQVRFGDRLTVQKCIPAELEDCLVPTLILQPLVENALKHGIEPEVKAGTVQIVAEQLHDRLLLRVTDSGSGLPLSGTEQVKEGIGLGNTRARLHTLHPNNHFFHFALVPSGGATATVELPVKRKISSQTQ